MFRHAIHCEYAPASFCKMWETNVERAPHPNLHNASNYLILQYSTSQNWNFKKITLICSSLRMIFLLKSNFMKIEPHFNELLKSIYLIPLSSIHSLSYKKIWVACLVPLPTPLIWATLPLCLLPPLPVGLNFKLLNNLYNYESSPLLLGLRRKEHPWCYLIVPCRYHTVLTRILTPNRYG